MDISESTRNPRIFHTIWRKHSITYLQLDPVVLQAIWQKLSLLIYWMSLHHHLTHSRVKWVSVVTFDSEAMTNESSHHHDSQPWQVSFVNIRLISHDNELESHHHNFTHNSIIQYCRIPISHLKNVLKWVRVIDSQLYQARPTRHLTHKNVKWIISLSFDSTYQVSYFNIWLTIMPCELRLYHLIHNHAIWVRLSTFDSQPSQIQWVIHSQAYYFQWAPHNVSSESVHHLTRIQVKWVRLHKSYSICLLYFHWDVCNTEDIGYID